MITIPASARLTLAILRAALHRPSAKTGLEHAQIVVREEAAHLGVDPERPLRFLDRAARYPHAVLETAVDDAAYNLEICDEDPMTLRARQTAHELRAVSPTLAALVNELVDALDGTAERTRSMLDKPAPDPVRAEPGAPKRCRGPQGRHRREGDRCVDCQALVCVRCMSDNPDVREGDVPHYPIHLACAGANPTRPLDWAREVPKGPLLTLSTLGGEEALRMWKLAMNTRSDFDRRTKLLEALREASAPDPVLVGMEMVGLTAGGLFKWLEDNRVITDVQHLRAVELVRAEAHITNYTLPVFT